MTTPAQAKRLIVVSAVAVAGIGTVRAIRDHGNVTHTLRPVLGAAVVAFVLSLGAESVPQLVTPFAGIMLAGAVLIAGPDLWRAIGHAVNATEPPAPRPVGAGFGNAAGAAAGGAAGGAAGLRS